MTTYGTLIGPALAALLTVGGWLVAQSRDDHGLPRRSLVGLGQWMAMAGLLLALLSLPRTLPPTTYAAVLAGTLLVGLGLVRGAGRLAIGWTSVAEVITAAAMVAWTRPKRAVWSLVCLGTGLSLAAWLAGRGEPLAGLLGAAVALAPVRWHLPSGYRRERATTGVEVAMAGALAGGVEWETAEANLRGAPVRARFDGDDRPSVVSAPLPPGWKAASEETLSSEINSRLSAWGTPWITTVDHSRRRLVATKGAPLPDLLPWDGRPAQGHRVTLGLARVSPAAAAAGVGQVGAVRPYTWDLADSPAGLITGTAGGGKSVLVRLLIVQCAMAGWQVWLIDPKRVEMTPFRGRRGITAVATSVPEIRDTMRRLRAEMERRYDLLEAAGKQKMDELVHQDQEPPILVVVDEAFELMIKESGSDDSTKEENEMRAQIASDTRKIAAMARAADLHEVLLAQRADAEVVKGSLQNNLPFRALMRPATAGATARNMIGMSEVEPSGNPRGRAVMRTDLWPESEVQVAYLDAAALDRYLPKVALPPQPKIEPDPDQNAGEVEAPTAKPASDEQPEQSSAKRASTPRNNRPVGPRKDDDQSGSNSGERDGEQGPSSDPVTELDFDPFADFD